MRISIVDQNIWIAFLGNIFIHLINIKQKCIIRSQFDVSLFSKIYTRTKLDCLKFFSDCLFGESWHICALLTFSSPSVHEQAGLRIRIRFFFSWVTDPDPGFILDCQIRIRVLFLIARSGSGFFFLDGQLRIRVLYLIARSGSGFFTDVSGFLYAGRIRGNSTQIVYFL